MSQIAVFLNDLSFAREMPLSSRQLLPHVLRIIEVLKRAKKIRRDFAVDGETTLSEAQIGRDAHGLSSILQGNDFREEWEFLRNLDQASPWGKRDKAIAPPATQEVRYCAKVANAMLWANRTRSAILSFSIEQEWAQPFVRAQFCVLDERGIIRETGVEIPNLAMLDHVDTHQTLIRDYGIERSESSVIYKGDGFVVRIYFNDHNTPHFHVMASGNTAETLARISIGTLDILDSPRALSPSIRKKVMQWAASQKQYLMWCWEECMAHRHPPMIEEQPC